MTEMEIINQFNVFLISNSVYLAAGAFLIWVAFRMVVNVQSDPGTPMLNKVLATLFGLTTSLGLGARQAASGLSYLFDIPSNLLSQSLVIIFITPPTAPSP